MQSVTSENNYVVCCTRHAYPVYIICIAKWGMFQVFRIQALSDERSVLFSVTVAKVAIL